MGSTAVSGASVNNFFTKVRFALILKDIKMKTKDSIINLVIESLLKKEFQTLLSFIGIKILHG